MDRYWESELRRAVIIRNRRQQEWYQAIRKDAMAETVKLFEQIKENDE